MQDFEIIRHLAERGGVFEKYRLSIGDGVAVFPLWTFGGRMKGYQQYRPRAPKHCQNPKDALGSDVCSPLRQQMALSPYQWVFAGDLDAAGLKFSKTFGRGFVSPDLDELSTEEVFALASRAVEHG